MGIDTLGVMAGHIGIAEISEAMREALPGVSVVARQLTGPNVWVFEAVSADKTAIAVTAFLNSHAAEDYRELGLSESTMLLVEHGPQSQSLVKAIIKYRPGWVRAHDGAEWQGVSAN